MDTIKDRILKLPVFIGVSKEKFFSEIDQNYGNYRGLAKKSAPSSEVVAKILIKYPEFSPDWLLTGRGSMYRSEGGAVQSVSGNGNTSVQGSGRVQQAPQATQSVSELQKCKEEVERLHERLKEANWKQ